MKSIVTAAMLLLTTGAFAQKSNDLSINAGRGYTRFQNSGAVTGPTQGAFNTSAAIQYTHTKGSFILGGELGMARLYDHNYIVDNIMHFEDARDIYFSKQYLSPSPETVNVSIIGGMKFGGFKTGVKAGVSIGTDIWNMNFANDKSTPLGGNVGLYVEYVQYIGRFGLGASLIPTVHIMKSNANNDMINGVYTIYSIPVMFGVHYKL